MGGDGEVVTGNVTKPEGELGDVGLAGKEPVRDRRAPEARAPRRETKAGRRLRRQEEVVRLVRPATETNVDRLVVRRPGRATVREPTPSAPASPKEAVGRRQAVAVGPRPSQEEKEMGRLVSARPEEVGEKRVIL